MMFWEVIAIYVENHVKPIMRKIQSTSHVKADCHSVMKTQFIEYEPIFP